LRNGADMTLTTLPPAVEEKIRAREHFVLRGVNWGFYEAVLREVGDDHVFVTYDRGELEFMSPLRPHELYKKVIDRMIYAWADITGAEVESGGSMTMRREDLDRGLEPDECYYTANAARMTEMRNLDLTQDPPPDLVVEMDYTHRTLDREGIYAAMGVPEVWRFDQEKLEILKLVAGQYESVETSQALWGLPRGGVERFVKMRGTKGEAEVVRLWRDWLREWVKK
jgi:Uma2 family endonuclease